MNWANYTLCAIYILVVGISLAEHGTPKKGTNNAWSAIIMLIILSTLLYFGGWFK